MMIVEHKADYPIVLLNEERYDYYKECERKANLTENEIRKGALRMFKEWSNNPDFKVEITMRSLSETIKHSPKTSFFTEWHRNRFYGVKEMECPRFVFDASLNDAVNEYISEAYKEHREELEKEFQARYSKRAKTYLRMRKIVLCQWAAILALVLLLIFV